VVQSLLVAKKLKKEWVVKQKTKSKWNAQKRREGILTQRDARPPSGTLGGPPIAEQPSEIHEERDVSADVDQVKRDGHSDGSQISTGDEQASTASVKRPRQKARGKEEDVTSTGSRLRELQKQAYSPAALHHYKSRSLHHSKSRVAHDARIPASESSRKKDVGGTLNRTRRGGQPDMRLRMSAMLEKIKRDYS